MHKLPKYKAFSDFRISKFSDKCTGTHKNITRFSFFFVKNKQRRVQQFDWIFLKTRELISVFIDKRELFAVDFLRMKRHDLALSDAYSINPISYETSRRRFSRVDTT